MHRIPDKIYQDAIEKHTKKLGDMVDEFFLFRADKDRNCKHCELKIEAKMKQLDKHWRKYQRSFIGKKNEVPPHPDGFINRIARILKIEEDTTKQIKD